MIDGIPQAAKRGDAGMANLIRLDNHERDIGTRAGLLSRIPLIDAALARLDQAQR